MKTSFNKVFATPIYPTHLINRKIEIVTEDGLILRGWQVSPPPSSTQEPKGNIVIVHGFKDYSERYLEFAGELARNGYQVFGYDQRGHARSDGDRAYFPNFELVTNDLQLALESFKKYDNKKPWIILGHSIGGSIAARFALTHESEIAGLILSAPALKPMPDLQGLIISALRAANIVAPHMGVIDLPDKDFSRDPNVVARMKEDELITKSKIPARSGFGALMNMEFVQENKSKAKVPFLILHGSDDHINNIEGSREFYEETPNIPGKDLKIYPSLYHDLLHEPEHEKVEKDILNWVNLISSRKHISHSEVRPYFS